MSYFNVINRRFILAAALMLSAAIVALFAFTLTSSANPIQVQLDDEALQFEVDPMLVDGTTLVPFRVLFEAMGLEIDWDNSTKTITGTKDGLELMMSLGQSEAMVNGQALVMAQSARIVDGYTLVPLRFISESTGSIVGWNPYVPEVVVFTEAYWIEQGTSREELEARIKREVEEAKAAQNKPAAETPPSGNSSYQPADPNQVNLNGLQGMYSGYRADPNGYECGGLCWDYYTFLPNQQVVVGLPENGGPEMIDCAIDDCQSYTIAGGNITLANGESYPISVVDQELHINDVKLTAVQPLKEDLKLTYTYEHYGQYGAGGLAGYSSSWIYTFIFDASGNFELDTFRIGSMMGGATTVHGVTGDDGSGTYSVSGNTLTLTYSDGTIVRELFFEHDNPEMGELEDIQIGAHNYYIE